MRCENCGKNEANFIYRSSINGRTEEHHLCQACAEKLGYTRNFFDQRPSLMDSLFGNSDFFDSMPSLMGRMLESPFDDFFDTMPAIGAGPVREVPVEKKENLMSDEKQSRFFVLSVQDGAVRSPGDIYSAGQALGPRSGANRRGHGRENHRGDLRGFTGRESCGKMRSPQGTTAKTRGACGKGER